MGTPKTAGSRTVVVLPEHAVAALDEQRERQAERRSTLGPYFSDDGWVFDRGDGGMSTNNAVRHRFESDCALAEVPRITFHQFSRHLAATLSVELNIPIDVVAKSLRHRSIETTARHYRHVTAGEQERAAGLIDAAIFGDD